MRIVGWLGWVGVVVLAACGGSSDSSTASTGVAGAGGGSAGSTTGGSAGKASAGNAGATSGGTGGAAGAGGSSAGTGGSSGGPSAGAGGSTAGSGGSTAGSGGSTAGSGGSTAGSGGTTAGTGGSPGGAGGSSAGASGSSAGTGGASGGAGGPVAGTGGSAGAATAQPECKTDDDCALQADCCACAGVPKPGASCLLACALDQCAPLQLTAKCAAGRCVTSANCDQKQALCKSLPPTCPKGQTPTVDPTTNCWGPCLAVEECASVPTCQTCTDAGLLCVTYSSKIPQPPHCIPLPKPCAAPTCACVGPSVCDGIFSSCGENGDTLSCQCPTCG